MMDEDHINPKEVALEKRLVIDSTPKIVSQIKFGIPSSNETKSQSVVEISDRRLFDRGKYHAIVPHGPLDARLGHHDWDKVCQTCQLDARFCNGHFGHLKLVLPCFHVGYFQQLLKTLQSVCKECSHILLTEQQRRGFTKELHKQNLDSLRRAFILQSIHDLCRKVAHCPECRAVNGTVKKVGTSIFRIIHDQFSVYAKSKSTRKAPPSSKIIFERSFDETKRSNKQIEDHVAKAKDDLNPLRVFNILQKVSTTDCELLGFDPRECHPVNLLYRYIPAPPVCIRPSVNGHDGASTEDDLTSKLSEIVYLNEHLKTILFSGGQVERIVKAWDDLQLHIAMYINSETPEVRKADISKKSMRGLVQRLKGKQGRFRGNLSGKRVEFSGRTVITADPYLQIDEVGVPEQVAKTLTIPEVVTRHNIKRMRSCVGNGVNKWPGAQYILKKDDGRRIWLKYGNKLALDQLKDGDVVRRHLQDGDVVLFNRQPSLHKHSILSHFVKVLPFRTFRLNVCVCTPYNADFDGDEMNLHVPQTEEARAEAQELMGVKHNLVTPKNGDPVIGGIQDFITTAYLISSRDVFLGRAEFVQTCLAMLEQDVPFDLPPPTILKPQALWTGKQVLNILMRPNRSDPVLVNLNAPCRQFQRSEQGQSHDFDDKDSWLVIRNSEIMCGVFDKSVIGVGKKDNVFYVILRDFGPTEAAACMNRLSRLCATWLTNVGFSTGIEDVKPSKGVEEKIRSILAMSKHDYRMEVIDGGEDRRSSERRLTGILSKVRSDAGDECVAGLSRYNSPLIMAISGAKGSIINISQMSALLGQQIIGTARIQDGFLNRSLPYFPRHAWERDAKGFIENSFFSGLKPTELFFHAMSGREGLIDTAVKTAETGYMSRRLMKSLEDLSAAYNNTVCTSSGSVVQFRFGDDNLDAEKIGKRAMAVDLERAFLHAASIASDKQEQCLDYSETISFCNRLLDQERGKLLGVALSGISPKHWPASVHLLGDTGGSGSSTDEFESVNRFWSSISHFIQTQGSRLRRDTAPSGFPAQQLREHMCKISEETLTRFIKSSFDTYYKAQVEPGHAVGAIAAQSLGEPGMQMTLKTFHFAGVAGMSITQGVPRIKEIINASREIKTPVITCPLLDEPNIRPETVKARIKKTLLRDIVQSCEERVTSSRAYFKAKINQEKCKLLSPAFNLGEALIGMKKGEEFADLEITYRNGVLKAHLDPENGSLSGDFLFRFQHLRRKLLSFRIHGHPGAKRVIIQKHDSQANTSNTVLVEGTGLKECMNTQGVDGRRTSTNNISEVRDVLGIEAARATIIEEINKVMGDLDIDVRHMKLLADVMTYKGDILGITRFGLAKMRDSVLQLASFEKTANHLFEAGASGRIDPLDGVSECIIIGKTVGLGTGVFDLSWKAADSRRQIMQRKTVFEDTWAGVYGNCAKGRTRRKGRQQYV